MKSLREVKTLLPGWDQLKNASPFKVAEQDGYEVKSYKCLVEKIAELLSTIRSLIFFIEDNPKIIKKVRFLLYFLHFIARLVFKSQVQPLLKNLYCKMESF